MLSSVTDAEGDAVQYQYNGNRLTRITKPDGSFREYNYIEQNGKWVLDWNRDEEESRSQVFYYEDLGNGRYLAMAQPSGAGAGEQFFYDFDSSITTFTNPSGVTETYRFDNQLHTVRTDYPNGSYTEKEWEGDNVIRYRDNSGNYI